MIVGHRYTIFSGDIAASRRFYEDLLQCTISDESEVGFTATRDKLTVIVEGGAKPRKLGKRWLAESGLYITLEIDDFDRVVEGMAERGVPFLDEVSEAPDGKRVTGFADPDGVLYEVREA
jgi:catechol 2,3-dioxygenase-like lactoylglutathione lyase family enzyme